MILAPNDLLKSIAAHGEAEYPHECCGILLGKLLPDGQKTLEALIPVSNARDAEHRHNRFLITPEELLQGELQARKRGLDVVGFYHSHPDHPAVPSGYDLDHAWPTYSYIIVSVNQAKAGDLFSWELESDRTHFNSEILKEKE